MSHALSTLSQSLSIFAPTNRKGEVTKQTAKAARLLEENKSAVIGAALYGRGAVGAVARATMSAVVPSLSAMLSRESIDGSEWGTLLALLVADGGMSDYNESSHKGKAGCVAYCATAIKAAELAFDRADTAKAQERAIARIERTQQIAAQVGALVEAAEAARRAADAEAARIAADATEATQAA